MVLCRQKDCYQSINQNITVPGLSTESGRNMLMKLIGIWLLYHHLALTRQISASCAALCNYWPTDGCSSSWYLLFTHAIKVHVWPLILKVSKQLVTKLFFFFHIASRHSILADFCIQVGCLRENAARIGLNILWQDVYMLLRRDRLACINWLWE